MKTEESASTPVQRGTLLSELLSNRLFHLIILPTEQCNFRCTYCYEDFAIGRMSERIVWAVKSFLEKRVRNLDYLTVSWFGGEPLVAKDIILDISTHIMALKRKHPALRYKGTMTTNGYLLSCRTLEALSNVGIRRYQISLDGPAEFHNRSRIRADGTGTYDRIWANLLGIRDSSADVSILLRIHYSAATFQFLDPLIEEIRREFMHDSRFSVLFEDIKRLVGGMSKMMGEQQRTESLFYYFRLEDQIPNDHLLRLIDRHIDFSFVRERLRMFYSSTGRPSIDPEVLLRLLLVGYLYGITSERCLLEEVRMHLAYRWFSRLGFEQEIPDHSTFSKNRHGRFRQSDVFRKVFEEIVQRCLEAGLVEGRTLAVDGTLVGANASNQSRVPRERLVEAAQVSRTVQEYLTELEQQNPVADQEERAMPQPMVSTTDPDAAWTVKSGPATLGYYDNYLVDTASCVILSVEATPARFRQEMLAARRMLEHVARFGIRPQNLAADKAYGSGEFLAWLLARDIQPHIPVIDRRHQTRGRFTREQFRYEPQENAYYCPEGKPLHYRGQRRSNQGDLYRSTEAQCHGCPQKKSCTRGPYRRLFVHWQEPVRQAVRALAGTPEYQRSRRARYKVEALFAELKQQIKLRRVRLRRRWNVAEQFHLAATAQNLKRLVRHLAQKQSLTPGAS